MFYFSTYLKGRFIVDWKKYAEIALVTVITLAVVTRIAPVKAIVIG